MDKIGEMKVFIQVVEAGGFSGAARAASLTPSAVSKLIARLEDRLTVLLFQRTSRNVTLTPEGEQFYAHARHVMRALEEAEAAVANSASAVSGTLRIFSYPAFARYQLAPLMPEFLRQHPTLTVEFQLSNEPLRSLDSGVDVAIQSGELIDSTLVVRKFATGRWYFCASPEYVAARGAPQTPEELHDHDCLNFGTGSLWNTWSFGHAENSLTSFRALGKLSSNNGDMVLALARAGCGIGRFADFHAREELEAGRLVRVLRAYEDPTEWPIYALYHSRRHLSPRVKAFLAMLSANFGGHALQKAV